MVEVVAVTADMVHPRHEAAPFVAADGVAVFVHVAPAHELLHVLNLDVIGIEAFDVTEEVFGKGATVGIPWQASLGFAEVGAFERSPQHHLRARILLAALFEVCGQGQNIQSADVLGIVDSIGMVGGMAGNGVGIVIDTGNHLGAFLAANAGSFHAYRGATGSAEEIDV